MSLPFSNSVGRGMFILSANHTYDRPTPNNNKDGLYSNPNPVFHVDSRERMDPDPHVYNDLEDTSPYSFCTKIQDVSIVYPSHHYCVNIYDEIQRHQCEYISSYSVEESVFTLLKVNFYHSLISD